MNRKIATCTVLAALFALFATGAQAKVRLPRLIGDRMVLQRDAELKIWGWADAGEKVTVKFRDVYYDTQADASGRWHVMLPPQPAGGPYLMEVNEHVIRDILVGDVYLCSGQSNQETPIARLVELFPEIEVANNPNIRHFKVPTSNTPEALQEDIPGGAVWHLGTASEVMNWTALAYFLAQELNAYTRVPIGMLVSSLGGSAIESWVPQEELKPFPDLMLDKAALDSVRRLTSDQGAGRWADPDLDDAAWQTVQLPGTWQEAGIKARGVVWYRKTIELDADMAGKFSRLYMGTLVDNDSVFVNGTFVGRTTYTYPPRKYNVPAGVLREGKNVIAVKLAAPAGNGEFVKDKPYKLVNSGGEVSLTGAWKCRVGMNLDAAKPYEARLKNLKRVGSGLYNGMIYPLRDYRVKAAVWYQGETNAGNPAPYETLLKGLIKGWREVLQTPDLPFLLVQLPNFMQKRGQPSESGWAGIREAQLQVALTVPHTALATTYDVGEWNDIHPLNKKTVAQRLLLGARRIVYGEKKLTSSGPLYKDMQVDGNRVILTFTETGRGLAVKGGGKLKHFAIAGADGKYVWADAVIRGNKVIVSSPEVTDPVAVRYAWSDNPSDANLCNKEGLLASPFQAKLSE